MKNRVKQNQKEKHKEIQEWKKLCLHCLTGRYQAGEFDNVEGR